MILLLSASLAFAAPAPAWEPQDWPAPALGVSASAAHTVASTSTLLKMYRWYRKQSDKDGARCPYYPTCSAYGLKAVQTWGVPGLWLTGDRLMREYPWMGKVDDYPIVTPYGTPRFYDPVPLRRRDRG